MEAQEEWAVSNDSGSAGLVGWKPQCLNCAWLDKSLTTCRAFPGGIPIEIRLNEVDHRLPYPNDGNRQYIPINALITHPMDREREGLNVLKATDTAEQ